MTTIEHLSNEIFYEIFEYFDAYVIFNGFSNLNERFQLLLNSSLTRLKLDDNYAQSKELFLNNYEELLHNHHHQALSIHSFDENTTKIISTIKSNLSLFQSLQSLILYSIKSGILSSLIHQLSSLPNFYSLTIDLCTEEQDHTNIYQPIFNLAKLKYLKYRTCDNEDIDIVISLPIATTDQQKTSIEYFIMDHGCSIKDLFTLLSYTPNVRYLKFLNLIDINDLNTIEPIKLINLTKLSMEISEMTFDEFEILIKKIRFNLKILSLDIRHEDMSYLNAKRWEDFLHENLLQLEKLYFKKTVYFSDDYETPMYLGEQNEFNSIFWLERRWIFKVENDSGHLIYSIQPYKRNWYEYGSESNQLLKSVEFEIVDVSPEHWVESIHISDHIYHALTITQIYHLRISTTISLENLYKILLLLPDIETLSLFRLLFTNSTSITDEELQLLCLLFRENHFQKLSFSDVYQVADVHFLMLICFHVNHLHLHCKDYNHVESFVGLILSHVRSRTDSKLRLLSFTILKFANDMIEFLTKISKENKLLNDFIIEQINSDVYIKWT
ncbi:unnamed protein product [Adineta steineri]|uniref:F-box domain-containing protein n=1 Tax=Adineta steineri TaxID=433720 RepID=A0A815UXN3_9BILA|nr:unnamed protein product [Adineta steineri]CAF1497166.1 unnamed protein product [Adineta steineri]CAF1522014.1 unnamed protein product [Adineta steineri]CAF1643302.1 unnamed protein product [Adineta steineri]